MAPVLVAPDSFKGTFSAVEVADAIGRGLRAAGVQADLCPVADGGEGTMETLLASIGGEVVEVEGVLDPLRRHRRAPFGLIEGGRRAIVEMAAASGLGLVAEDERDAWAATTYGTGQLIHAAAQSGASEIMVAAGGLSGGLWAGLGASLEPGAPYVLDAVRFEDRLRGARGVIAGEGRIDEQSVMGKIVGEIGDRALAAGVPLFAIVGQNSVPPEAAERIALRGVHEATTLEAIEATAERLGREIAAGRARGAGS